MGRFSFFPSRLRESVASARDDGDGGAKAEEVRAADRATRGAAPVVDAVVASAPKDDDELSPECADWAAEVRDRGGYAPASPKAAEARAALRSLRARARDPQRRARRPRGPRAARGPAARGGAAPRVPAVALRARAREPRRPGAVRGAGGRRARARRRPERMLASRRRTIAPVGKKAMDARDAWLARVDDLRKQILGGLVKSVAKMSLDGDLVSGCFGGFAVGAAARARTSRGASRS
ncbi:hypothetical protein JL720_8647 [Aureococcus anophagefferens]|nr:hypothetical protein JL720_8647 [Aureococcus anophagefferens]